MRETFIIALSAFALLGAAQHADARVLRHGAPEVCSVMSHHPCLPTSCSVFDRNPCVPDPQYGIGQDLHVTIESGKRYDPPDHDLNTIGDLFAELRACWQPPPLDEAREGMQATVRFGFNRNGQLIAPPRSTYISHDAPQEAKQIYRGSIEAAFERCAPLHFTPGLAGAIAGRPITIRFIETRLVEGHP
ncbi:MAG: hypothetical protein ACXWKC_15800 [Xanthobacteraceae bacterium]